MTLHSRGEFKAARTGKSTQAEAELFWFIKTNFNIDAFQFSIKI